LLIANKELAFQNEEKEKRAQEALQMADELRRLTMKTSEISDRRKEHP